MSEELLGKVCKSGNSVALRLPKGWGFAEGDEVVVVPHQDGTFSFWKQDVALQVLLSLYGSMSPGFMKEGRGDIEQDDRVFDGRESAR